MMQNDVCESVSNRVELSLDAEKKKKENIQADCPNETLCTYE